jgi:uncharacterized protein YjbI with pentapeptide repeats
MANPEHLSALRNGVQHWNRLREERSISEPDLRNVDLSCAQLGGVDLSYANLWGAKLIRTNFHKADLTAATFADTNLMQADLSMAALSGANLSGALLWEANLSGAALLRADLTRAVFADANLRGADLRGARLGAANLSGADLSGCSNLTEADLTKAMLVGTNLENATLDGCNVYGLSAWDVKLDGSTQSNLIISPPGEPQITVDNLQVAQFIYLLLTNANIRQVIDTIGRKLVLILGRFTPERKRVLDGIREALRKRDYLPVLFDFTGPESRNITETMSTLAHMARFVIADITDAKSIPQELQRIVPDLPSVPVQTVLLETQHPWGMFADLLDYPWVLNPLLYKDQEHLLAVLDAQVIDPAVAKATEIQQRRQSVLQRPKS